MDESEKGRMMSAAFFGTLAPGMPKRTATRKGLRPVFYLPPPVDFNFSVTPGEDNPLGAYFRDFCRLPAPINSLRPGPRWSEGDGGGVRRLDSLTCLRRGVTRSAGPKGRRAPGRFSFEAVGVL